MKTTEEFIKEAIKIHGSKYEYQKACYLKSNIKIIITCKEHGDFEQSTKKHLQGQGCKQCGYIKNGNLTRLTTEQFIEKANLIHNNYYSYEFTNYISNKEKVIITCPIHGDFPQTASSHLQGVNCKSCSHIKSGESGRKGIEEILKKFNKKHKDFYVYNLNEDIKTDDIIEIICPNHGKFSQKVSVHYRSGCPKCGNERIGEYQRKKPKELDRVCRNLRRRLKKFMQKKGFKKTNKTCDIIGLNWVNLKCYLEDNPYNFKTDCLDLDTDHIIPISSAKTEEDLYKLTHYTNLQLLPKDYNQHIKRDNPFDREHFEKWLIETKYNKC